MTWQIECSRHNPSGRIGLRLMLRHSSSAGIPPPSHSLPEPKTNGVAGDVSFLSASKRFPYRNNRRILAGSQIRNRFAATCSCRCELTPNAPGGGSQLKVSGG